MNVKHLILSLFAIVALAACNTSKDIPYMVDAEQIPADVLQAAARAADPVVMPGDMLQINVTSTNIEAVRPFNKIDLVSNLSSSSSSTTGNNNNAMYYYLVDNNGNIDFPMLGTLHVGGKTQSAIQEEIAGMIYPKYLTEKPGVEVRFQNFRVYALGEVKSPGVISAPNGRMNLLEALAQAGDLTIQGRRDNVMIIRTNADGSRMVERINLSDKNIIVSPMFNLQQNDIIYVQPNASKARSSWQVPPALTLGMSSVGTLISIITLVVTLTKK